MHPSQQRAWADYRTVEDSLTSTPAQRDAAFRAYTDALEACETIDQRCFRLGLMAADKDAEAERHMAAEAAAAGMAAGRRLAGNDDAYAASFDREAAACRECALDAQAQAERLRSQAAALRRAQSYAEDVVSSIGPRSAARLVQNMRG